MLSIYIIVPLHIFTIHNTGKVNISLSVLHLSSNLGSQSIRRHLKLHQSIVSLVGILHT